MDSVILVKSEALESTDRIQTHDISFCFSQNLCRARANEIETEDHMKLVAQREKGRLKQEILRLENDLADLKERKNMYEVGNGLYS